MKKKVIALFLSTAMVASLAACGNTATTTQESTPAAEEAVTEDAAEATTEAAAETATEEVAETPVEGGQLIYGTTTDLGGDWAFGMWTNAASDVLIYELTDQGYQTVVSDQGGMYMINPTVVKEYTTTDNEDGTKTFTVTINEGLTYNNGEAITAKDYVVQALFTCSQAALDMGASVSGYMTYVGGQEFKDGTASAVSGIRLLDDYTYSFTIVADKLPYYYDVTYAAANPMNLKYWFGEGVDIADDGEGCYWTADISTEEVAANVQAARFGTSDRVTAGPYNLQEFDASSLQATLVRNENYIGNFEGQTPYIDTIVVTKAEEETWNDAMKTGALDFYDTVTDGTEVNAALDLVDAGGFDYVQFDRAGYGKIQFQCDFGPTQFAAVRQAVAHLLDRNEFANTFCQGWGGIVDGPYGTGLWQYKDAEEWLADNLDTYAYSVDDAEALLVEDGWTLDAEGNDWAGEGLRYKEVTAEEAGEYAGNVTLADGRILMPLSIQWSSSEGNAVSDLLSVMLAESDAVASVGMEIVKTEMSFTELLNYMYRDSSQGEQYGVPTYGMYNLATGFTPAYDFAYNWTMDPELVALGYNTNFLYDEQMDQLSMDMVYGVEAGDDEAYMEIWKSYIKRWNELLPEVPLYSNVYISVFNDKLHGYTQDSFWDFQNAILYAWVEE